MSQLVACVTGDSVLIAADRRVEVRHDNSSTVHTARKLFGVGARAAVATSGAAVGIHISQMVAKAFAQKPNVSFPEVEEYAMAVFQREYAAFIARGTEWFAAHPKALKLSYVLLAGRDGDGGRHVRFYASEDHGDAYRPLSVGSVLAAPRRLGLETRLSQALAANAPTMEIRGMLFTHLSRIAELDEAVGGPFDLATLGPSGIVLETIERT